jgi:hypothetical protein
MRLASLALLVLAFAPATRATIVRVPEDRPTITDALTAATAGDVISVAPGTYSARSGESFPLVLSGHTVILEGDGVGQCTLDGEGTSRLLVFESGDASIVRGLNLVGGYTDGAGGAILVSNASPEIAHVRFSRNRAEAGGDAVAVDRGEPSIRNCLFTANGGDRGTIKVDRGAPVIEFCTLHGNGGAGLLIGGEADPTLRASVVSRPGRGGGPSVGLLLTAEAEAVGWPAIERNLFTECRDGVYWIDAPPRGTIQDALEEARRHGGLREGDSLDRALRPRGFDAYELGVFAGPDPLPDSGSHDLAEDEAEPERLLGPTVPNPFHPSTTIYFQVPEHSVVDLGVYNVLGQRVRTLLAGDLAAGDHTATWDGHDELGVEAPPGIYFVRITQGRRPPESRRLVLVR